jgi:glutathione S-transferase
MTAPTDALEVFWISGSPFAWRVLLALEIKGLDYKSTLLQASKGEHKTPEYLALNPRGKVPTLRHGAFVLPESLAILAYLDRRFPEPPLLGTSAEEAGRIWAAIASCVSYLEPPSSDVITPVLFGADKARADWADRLRSVRDELATLDQRLRGNDWLAAPTISAADIAVYPFLRLLLRAADRAASGPFDLGLGAFASDYPGLAAWMARIEALPGYARTYPPHWGPPPGR